MVHYFLLYFTLLYFFSFYFLLYFTGHVLMRDFYPTVENLHLLLIMMMMTMIMMMIEGGRVFDDNECDGQHLKIILK